MTLTTAQAEELLTFPVDMPLRRRWMVPDALAHPAKMHLGLQSWLIERYTEPGQVVCDPLAGVGGILLAAALGRNVIARDVEPRWIDIMHRNAELIRGTSLFAGLINIGRADAREPWGYRCDVVITSPPYGCSSKTQKDVRMALTGKIRKLADTPHNRRWRYLVGKIDSGAAASLMLHYGTADKQVGALRGNAYWQAMSEVYTRARDALKPGGRMVLVLKDHILRGERVRTADRTVTLCEGLGFRLVARHARLVYPLSLWTRRRKERGEPVVEDESVLVLEAA